MSLPEWARELGLEVEAAKAKAGAKAQEQAQDVSGKLRLSQRETPWEVRQQLSPFCWRYRVGKPSQWTSGEEWEGYADLYLAEECIEQAAAAWQEYLEELSERLEATG